MGKGRLVELNKGKEAGAKAWRKCGHAKEMMQQQVGERERECGCVEGTRMSSFLPTC